MLVILSQKSFKLCPQLEFMAKKEKERCHSFQLDLYQVQKI